MPWVCGNPGCFWVSGEYLYWWIKDSQLPPLITTAKPGSSLLPGALGQPGTNVLFGNSGFGNGPTSGGRFSGGVWLNDGHSFGLEAGYFFLGPTSGTSDFASSGAPGSPVIARPFYDVLSGAQNAQLAAYPGLANGDVSLHSTSFLQGAWINGLCNICFCSCSQTNMLNQTNRVNMWAPGACYYRLMPLAGFAFLNLDEGLGINETTHVNPLLPASSPFFGGSTIASSDQFNTQNYFYGGQVGGRAYVSMGRMFVEATGQVGVGVTHSVVDIAGSTVNTPLIGAPVVTPSGFLASGSNIGQFNRDQFAVVPQVGVNVGCWITNNLRAFVGYTFIYWSSVATPGSEINQGLNGTNIPTDLRYNPQAGPAGPAFAVRDTSFWAQGLNFGMEVNY